MAAFNKFRCVVQDLGRKVHNLHTDTLKVMLTNVAPVNTNTVLANLTDLATANGYTAGGTAMTGTSWTQTAGTAKLTGSNVVFTASGGSIGPFQYAVLYNSTASGGPLLGWWDYSSAVTITAGNTFSVLPTDTADIMDLV
jgi:hypothetical protein